MIILKDYVEILKKKSISIDLHNSIIFFDIMKIYLKLESTKKNEIFFKFGLELFYAHRINFGSKFLLFH